MSNWFKRNSIHLAIILFFVILCIVYFNPVLQGKMLYQGDVLEAKAMQKEIMDVRAETGKGPLWTNAMFGGMPSYQIWVQYPNNITTYILLLFNTLFPNPVNLVLLYLLGGYLLFSVLRLNPWLAAGGAIAFAFSSFNFIIIEAGHNNQALAIAFLPPVIAGVILTFRGKYLIGSALTALFLAVEIRSNHIQMTYYLFVALIILAGFELYSAIKAQKVQSFLKALGFISIAGIIALAVNAGTLWTSYEYAGESIRGKANLTSPTGNKQSGLDRDYAYQWSQGIGEMITLLIPDAFGGASAYPALDEKSEVAQTLTQKGVPAQQAVEWAKSLPLYWGEKPGTSGPWYFGAIICFLFIFSLFIVKGSLKWWVISASLLFILLSFGKNLPLISDLFFYHVPLYNKFRSVEFALIIPAILFPLLAFVALKEIIQVKGQQKELLKKAKLSLYITGGICFFVWALPSLFFNFKSISGHEQLLQQITQGVGDRGFANEIGNALVRDRESIARTDAFRSLVFVLIGFVIIWALLKEKISAKQASILLAAAILIDLWSVDKRYLNNSKFHEQSELNRQFQPREADLAIQADKSPDYRVLDLTAGNPFFDATASYFHKSVGGRHSVRLQRFQEIIDRQFNGTLNEHVLDMLNTKYLITRDPQKQSTRAVLRPTACGNAWFVSSVQYVHSADEEMKAISSFDPRHLAIVHDSFRSLIAPNSAASSPDDRIKLVSYHPDHLIYQYTAAKDALAVFAEIWYSKGWNAYVNGKKIPLFRANYILRAACLPAGTHKLEFKFEPKSYYTGETISLIASILLVIGIGVSLLKIKPEKPYMP